MTDTKYVPLPLAHFWALMDDDEQEAAAVVLRVAGPDDAIVPRRELVNVLEQYRFYVPRAVQERHDDLDALDAAIAAAGEK